MVTQAPEQFGQFQQVVNLQRAPKEYPPFRVLLYQPDQQWDVQSIRLHLYSTSFRKYLWNRSSRVNSG